MYAIAIFTIAIFTIAIFTKFSAFMPELFQVPAYFLHIKHKTVASKMNV